LGAPSSGCTSLAACLSRHPNQGHRRLAWLLPLNPLWRRTTAIGRPVWEVCLPRQSIALLRIGTTRSRPRHNICFAQESSPG
jgi:hypothetical protein